MYQLNQLIGECCCISNIKKAINYELRTEVVIYKKRNWSLFLLKQSKGTPKTW